MEVNGELIFRFPRRSDGERRLEKEILLLKRLGRILSIPIPHLNYVWSGNKKYRYAFVGYRKLEGVHLTPDVLQLSRVDDTASQLSGFLNELHSFPVLQARKVKVPYTTPARWKTRYHRFRSQLGKRVFPLLSRFERERATNLIDEFLNEEIDFKPALLHGDLNGGNMIANRSTGKITGIIDWGDATIGDPAYDFCGLLYEYGEEFVRKVLSKYNGSADRSFWKRLVFYAARTPYSVLLGAEVIGLPYMLKRDEIVLMEGPHDVHFKLGEYSAA